MLCKIQHKKKIRTQRNLPELAKQKPPIEKGCCVSRWINTIFFFRFIRLLCNVLKVIYIGNYSLMYTKKKGLNPS